MSINLHGLKMDGLEAASERTANWGNWGGSTQIYYDTELGRVYTRDHCGQSWSEFRDASVICVCSATCHMSQQDIAEAIADAVAFREYLAELGSAD